MELQDAIWVGDIAAAGDTRKWSGEQAEAAFLHKATGLGLSVLTPWGDSERYDLVVGTGKRLLRAGEVDAVHGRETIQHHGARVHGAVYGGRDRFSGGVHCSVGFVVHHPGEGVCAAKVFEVLSGRGRAVRKVS